MRSLVAETFHSLSTKQLFGLVGEFVILRTPDHADRRVGCRRQFDPPFRRAAGRLRLQFVAGLQRARIGAAEAGAGIDGEAAEHRLAGDAAFDREIAERAAAGKAERQRLAVGKGCGRIRRHGAAGDIGIARGSRQRDAHRAAARGELCAERTDFDSRRERLIADQRIRGRQRQPIHRAARHQAVALGAGTSAVLYRTCRADRCNDELAHEAICSAMNSPASAARSCSAKVLASTGVKVTLSPGSSRKIGSRCSW